MLQGPLWPNPVPGAAKYADCSSAMKKPSSIQDSIMYLYAKL